MPVNVFDEYYMAITTLEAQEMLVEMRLSDYPNMKKNDRSKLHRQMFKLAYPKTETASSQDVAAWIKGKLNGR